MRRKAIHRLLYEEGGLKKKTLNTHMTQQKRDKTQQFSYI